jgi:hypothetical protein
MASKKKVRRKRSRKLVVTRSSKRRFEIVIGRKRVTVIPVLVRHHGSSPAKFSCEIEDLVLFINASGRKQVKIHFDVSPFLAGNGAQDIIVRDVPVLCTVGGPAGMYTSEAEASSSTSTPPDGPAVIVQ